MGCFSSSGRPLEHLPTNGWANIMAVRVHFLCNRLSLNLSLYSRYHRLRVVVCGQSKEWEISLVISFVARATFYLVDRKLGVPSIHVDTISLFCSSTANRKGAANKKMFLVQCWLVHGFRA